jgi:peptidoglycan/xylan/chitin deacetylase (PgdA/CDA1 family)
MSASRRVPVLMYHQVSEAHNDWEARYFISPRRFDGHMQALAARGYRAISVDDLVCWLEGGPDLPNKAVVITFDDGFRGVREHALHVLERLGWPFSVFRVTDLIGQVDTWDLEFNPSGETYPLLDADEIRDMRRRGVGFFSHTRSHASLPTLDDAALADQLAGSRQAIIDLLDEDVPYLAYPFGHTDDRVAAAARAAGYRAALSTRSGFNRRDVDPFQIRRIDVFGTDTPKMLLRKIQLGSNNGSFGHAARYYIGRLASRLPRVVR